MIVLSWSHKRRHLLNALAKLDSQVAARTELLESSWVEQYRLHPHEPSLPADITPAPQPTAPTPVAKPTAAPPAPAARVTVKAPRAPDNDLVTVPDYLR